MAKWIILSVYGASIPEPLYKVLSIQSFVLTHFISYPDSSHTVTSRNNDWICSFGHCYHFHTEDKKTHEEAKAFCEAKDARLVEFRTEEEITKFLFLLEHRHQGFDAETLVANKIYIGEWRA